VLQTADIIIYKGNYVPVASIRYRISSWRATSLGGSNHLYTPVFPSLSRY